MRADGYRAASARTPYGLSVEWIKRERSKGGFPRRKDAERYRVEVEQRHVLGGLYEAPAETLGRFLDGWLERYEQRVRPPTYERAVQALKQVREPFDAIRLPDLKAADVEDCVMELARRAPRQAQMGLAKMKQALADARKRGQVVDEAIFEIEPPEYEEREPRFLTWAEVELLASLCSEGRLVVFAALTGMRQGEIFALRHTAVDLAAREVRVEASVYDGRLTKTKTGDKWPVKLGDIAIQVLREQLMARAPNPQGLVFAAPQGGMWRKDNFMARVFRPAVRRAHLVGLTFHDLRHTCASLMIAASRTPLSERLG